MREREREREAETQAEGEAGFMHREPDVGLDPGSPGSRPGPKAGSKPLRHPEIPILPFFMVLDFQDIPICQKTGGYNIMMEFITNSDPFVYVFFFVYLRS